jgi:hypothetical protein
MAQIKMTYKANKAYYKELAGLYREEVEDFLHEAIQNTETDATIAAPVDDGFLRNSAYSEIEGLEGVVGFKAKYAPYQEFGTGGLVDIPEGMSDYASTFLGNGIKQINIRPQPFLYPAWKNNTIKFLDNLKKMLNNGTKQSN